MATCAGWVKITSNTRRQIEKKRNEVDFDLFDATYVRQYVLVKMAYPLNYPAFWSFVTGRINIFFD